MRIYILACLLASFCAPAFAHHSVAVSFDTGLNVQVEGQITSIEWRNPHILFTLTATDGSDAEWEIETHSLSIMRRLDAAEPFVAIGDQVKAAGWPSRQGRGMFVNNMLLPSGEEFVFDFRPEPTDLIWSDRMWGSNANWFAESGDRSDEERGIFRVWSTTLVDGNGFFWLPDYPLTSEAREIRNAFDAASGPLMECGLKGMPGIMGAPYPLEFLDRGDRIELRLEEYDTLRTIFLNPDTAPEPVPSIYGYSTGSWEGETLVVETSSLNWGHLMGRGIRLSDSVKIIERFTPAESGGRLEYQITVIDPTTFTEPVVMDKSWVYLPDVQVEPYECTL